MSNVNASRPAEAWTFEREAGSILQLFAAQIRAVAADGDVEGEALTAAFAGMASPTPEALETAAAGGAAALALVERLSQRLHHVADGLDQLTALLHDYQEAADPAAWDRLRSTIRDGYTLVAECEVFEAVTGKTS